MPRSSAQYEAMRAATLEKVQAAAITLFARHGFAATNMRDIAREAGMSTGLIYRHYATKDDLFAALAAQATDGLRRVAELFSGEGSPSAILEEFARELVDDIARVQGSAEFMLIMNQAFVSRRESAQIDALLDQHLALVDATVALVHRGQRLGEFRPGAATELATCWFAAVTGLATLKAALGDRFVAPHPSTLTGFLTREHT
ncbi:TetR/AcrR family transcriptional regulator [Pseudonocardia sp. DSM 110487]|uniref:TetR/AcrR family transcriptional regulator n=1 Tax=Pseudonocardia sp. DSM 110487 TaxID=2865833 RepID=UPI001C6A038E|nr:TetR/AcrR family transcriptional regulator [Pseudonocardia sp. DSM 110487]QYN37462.1 TetR/AcrR family transcriptional regulator [Pseudonocardia sp. DSM 110487]